jgi:hypothetical protein
LVVKTAPQIGFHGDLVPLQEWHLRQYIVLRLLCVAYNNLFDFIVKP